MKVNLSILIDLNWSSFVSILGFAFTNNWIYGLVHNKHYLDFIYSFKWFCWLERLCFCDLLGLQFWHLRIMHLAHFHNTLCIVSWDLVISSESRRFIELKSKSRFHQYHLRTDVVSVTGLLHSSTKCALLFGVVDTTKLICAILLHPLLFFSCPNCCVACIGDWI
jgi:hypothetical protein